MNEPNIVPTTYVNNPRRTSSAIANHGKMRRMIRRDPNDIIPPPKKKS
jgi:nitroimidazol reductase NimA-like FMN-containing flavoprotein (pyridoxamine 5'-phosphate oxidase superfamily)